MLADYRGTYLLPRIAGMAKGLELMYSCDIIDAEESWTEPTPAWAIFWERST
jgi:enoyl-CoA hydratase/carnithine racemase